MVLTRRKAGILFAALIAIGVYAWFHIKDDRTRIRERIELLAKWGSFGPDDSILAKELTARKLAELFTDDIVIEANIEGQDSLSIQGLQHWTEFIRLVRMQLQSLRLKFTEQNLEVLPDRTHANAHLTLIASLGSEKDLQYREFKCQLVKTKNGWQISRIETIKTWGR